MGREKLPAHELLTERLSSQIKQFKGLEDLPYTQHERTLKKASISLLVDLLMHVAIPEKHIDEVLDQLRIIKEYAKQHNLDWLIPAIEDTSLNMQSN